MVTDRETVKDVRRLCETNGLEFGTWSPGDGATRYRFFLAGDPGGSDYFGGSHSLGTVLGVKDAMTWSRGYRAAVLARESVHAAHAYA